MADPDFTLDPALDLAGAMAAIARLLADSGVEAARREARLIVGACLGLSAADLILQDRRQLGADAHRLSELALRRARREPFARLTGLREFHGLSFAVSPETLVPRPDTECLVDLVLDHVRRCGLVRAPLRIVDLGTGSGAILTALLRALPAASGLGIDCSQAAVATAAANFASHNDRGRARFAVENWLEGESGPFDLIVSNPPYIPTADLAGLEPEVRLHDPLRALDGGASGLEAFRAILKSVVGKLSPKGWLAFEFGQGQAADVGRLAGEAGYSILEVRADLSGIDRAMLCELS